MNIMAQTANIYNHLCDNLSKKIFENRLLYSLTENHTFINNVVNSSLEKSTLKKHRGELGAYLEQYKYRDIIIYGAGYFGSTASYLIHLCKAKVVAFCDSDAKKHGCTRSGYKVISPEQLKRDYSNSVVVIAVLSEDDAAEITEALLNLGFEKKDILNFKQLLRLCNFAALNLVSSQYFDPGIILPRLTKDEIFIDGGCCNCRTDIQFAKACNNEYKKIIAFEPDPKQYPLCVENSKPIKNITLHPYGLWCENAELSFYNGGAPGGAHVSDAADDNEIKIKAVKLDDILNGQEATFIKLDLEGAELNALKGAEQTILKCHPKLAICIYHKPEDVWEIPAYILSLHDDYKLYMRHYNFAATETVLYAV